MSSEQPKLNDSEAENKPASGESDLRRKLPTLLFNQCLRRQLRD
jgi:hypothetical protein